MMQYILLVFFVLLNFFGSAQKNLNMELVAQVNHSVPTSDIWGYVSPDGTEYAIVGTEVDCRIYSLSDPENPQLIATVEGATSIWRDYKSYGEYVYQITQRGNDGLRIIDMTRAPEAVSSVLFQDVLKVGRDSIALSTCHNLWIDTQRGHLFLAGCNLGEGGVLIFDIKNDPLSPEFIGAIDERYSHDVITRGDTLFSSEINEGNLGMYDIRDPKNPSLISRVTTSSFFTHNAWYSDDGKTVFTTDERANATIDAYDISDITSPERIERYQPVINGGVIPHNTHFHNGYLVTSWYSEGVVIVDAHRPNNLVRVGQYDTYQPARVGFVGAWGAYPYLPSGLILVSDLEGGLFIFKPTYQRAGYLEGEVVDAATGASINAAIITLIASESTIEMTDANGVFRTGSVESGIFQVMVEHPDYETQTIEVVLSPKEVTNIEVRLFRKGSVIAIAGEVIDEAGEPIKNAKLIIEDPLRAEQASTNNNGVFQSVVPAGKYDIYVAAWGYKGRKITRTIDQPLIEPIVLERGYEDDFFVDLGWQINGDARRGTWIRAIPEATFFRGKLANPGSDIDSDLNEYAYVTGNISTSAATDDVDDGTTILTSPILKTEGYQNATIEITPWFYNNGGESQPNDSMKVFLLSENDKHLVATFTDDVGLGGRWLDPLRIYVDSIFRRAKEVRLQIEVSDQINAGHLVEGGIDKFRMYEGPTPVYPMNQETIEVIISPSPNDGFFFIDAKTNEKMVTMKVYDMSGRLLVNKTNPDFDQNLPFLSPGMYLIDIEFLSGLVTRTVFEKF